MYIRIPEPQTMALVRESEDSILPTNGMPIERTFQVTHLPARSFPAINDVTEEAAHLKRGDWPPTQFSYWEDYKPIMRRLYIDEEKTLREVIEILENEFDFRATYVCPLSCSVGSISRIQV